MARLRRSIAKKPKQRLVILKKNKSVKILGNLYKLAQKELIKNCHYHQTILQFSVC